MATGVAKRLLNGRAILVVPKHWDEIPNQAVATTLAFQVPNPADAGSPHSANAVVVFGTDGNRLQDVGDSIRERLAQMPGTVVVSDSTNAQGVRSILTKSQQHGEPYVVFDVLAAREGEHVWCRLAYPLLEESTSDWNTSLVRDFNRLLRSMRLDRTRILPDRDQLQLTTMEK